MRAAVAVTGRGARGRLASSPEAQSGLRCPLLGQREPIRIRGGEMPTVWAAAADSRFREGEAAL